MAAGGDGGQDVRPLAQVFVTVCQISRRTDDGDGKTAGQTALAHTRIED